MGVSHKKSDWAFHNTLHGMQTHRLFYSLHNATNRAELPSRVKLWKRWDPSTRIIKEKWNQVIIHWDLKQRRNYHHSRIVERAYADSLISGSSTIFALSSSTSMRSPSAVAVIRISGTKSAQTLLHLTRSRTLPVPRQATLKSLRSLTDELLDKALVLWFPGPHSFTGEDMVELHVHGGRAVVEGILNSLSSMEGLSHARPGEFTRRAFENRKLDLTEVEGLADLIHAETEQQRIQALRQLNGELSKVYNDWKEELLKCLAHVEAIIDFGEDQHIDEGILEGVSLRIQLLRNQLDVHLKDSRRGERMRDGAQIAIVGPPNVGKSSLLNLLGTTRDVVEVMLNIGGYPVNVGDTAGIRSFTSDIIEQEGINRAKQRFREADIRICVLDIPSLQNIENKEIGTFLSMIDSDTLVVVNKEDLDTHFRTENIEPLIKGARIFLISCKTLKGIPQFLSGLQQAVAKSFVGSEAQEGAVITRARHRQHLQECREHLENFLGKEEELVLMAEELRSAIKCLGRITGHVDVERILDIVFSNFCIGK